MQLADWLARIETLRPEVIKLGLDRMRTVAERLHLLSLPGQIITVAGTNGKGSTVTLLDELARSVGLTTSVYTSPHLFHFNERVRQNGRQAADIDFIRAFEAVEAARQDVELTYFEFTTLAAFWLFQRFPTDLYLLEVGLGGRLDAVNLMDADVALVTSIGLDHMDWLGDTREAIGREKAGIARAKRPLLYGERDMPTSVAAVAEEKQAELLRAGREFGFDEITGRLFWQDNAITLTAAVPLGEDNLASALAALACLDIHPDAAAVRRVGGETQLSGRCQQIELDGRDWIFDVGHNREAVMRVAHRLPAHGGRTLALCGMLADKPADAVLALRDKVDVWFVTDLPGPRGGGLERFHTLLPDAHFYAQPAAAVASVLEHSQAGDRILVFGSFVTVAEVWHCLQLPESMPASRS